MKSRSTLRGTNNSVGHGNLLTILTVTEIMAKGNRRNWEGREKELQRYGGTSWSAGFWRWHFTNRGHVYYYNVTKCKLTCPGLASFIYELNSAISLSCKISVKWILATIFCYFHFYLPYQIYLSVIATTECQVVYKAHLFFILGCVCHAGVTSLLWKEMRVRTISISRREDARRNLWEHSSVIEFSLIWYTHTQHTNVGFSLK